MPLDFPAHLLALEARAWEEIQAGALTVDTARAVHEGVTAYAAEADTSRYEVEMGLKKTVRHPAEA
jgi:hypothetical protein